MSYKTDVPQDWCPGCGDYGILAVAQSVLTGMGIPNHQIALFSGIGCHGKIAHYVNVNGVHTLHGRSLPFAIGAKLSNPALEVLCFAGDGDGLGIGAGHLVHAGRRNVDLTYVIHNNCVYGLTKGQASPTLHLGVRTKSLPQPNINEGVNPVVLALATGATFVARSYAFDSRHLKEMLRRAVEHQGFAVLDVLQPCPTYNDVNTRAWYAGEDRRDPTTHRAMPRILKLEEDSWDPLVPVGATASQTNEKVLQALQRVMVANEDIPVGVFYENRAVPTYEDRIEGRIEAYRRFPPATQPVCDRSGRPLADVTRLLESFTV